MPKRAYIPYVPREPGPRLTPVVWVERSRSDLKRLSEQVQHRTGVAQQTLQRGGFPREAVPLHGDLAGLIEIKVDDPGGTYRTVLTVKLAGTIHVLHVFQKKSTQGIAIPRRVVSLIRHRLASAKALNAESGKASVKENE